MKVIRRVTIKQKINSYTKHLRLINVVMLEAEDEKRKYLNNKMLAWLYNDVYHKILPKDMKKVTIEWFSNSRKH